MIQIVCDCVVEVESRTEKSAKYKSENPGNVSILSGVVGSGFSLRFSCSGKLSLIKMYK